MSYLSYVMILLNESLGTTNAPQPLSFLFFRERDDHLGRSINFIRWEEKSHLALSLSALVSGESQRQLDSQPLDAMSPLLRRTISREEDAV